MKIVIATGSPTRQKIFSNLGISFLTHPTDIDEVLFPAENIENAVIRLAQRKAKTAFSELSTEEDVLVLAFDSLVALDDLVFGKPKNKEEAFDWFQLFRGKRVKAFSGVGIVGMRNGEKFETSFLEKSWIHFRKNSTDEQIRQFLAIGDWEGKAGGITVEGAGAWLVEKIEGDFPNVLGVPVQRIGEKLRELKIDPLEVFYERK